MNITCFIFIYRYSFQRSNLLDNHVRVEAGKQTILYLSTPLSKGVNYFGAWVIGIIPGNAIEFLFDKERIGLVDHTVMLQHVKDNKHLGTYGKSEKTSQ